MNTTPETATSAPTAREDARPTDPKPKAQLSTATALLFHIAARSHSLAELFGVEQMSTDRGEDEPKLHFYNVPRPWLAAHPTDRNYYTFDPDKFAARLDYVSKGQRHMMLWILNVWNSTYAERQGWHFDLFKALNTLDEGNRHAICWFLENPIWP